MSNLRGRGGGEGKVTFRLSGHVRILLFIAGELQKLDRQSIYHWNHLFINFHEWLLSYI